MQGQGVVAQQRNACWVQCLCQCRSCVRFCLTKAFRVQPCRLVSSCSSLQVCSFKTQHPLLEVLTISSQPASSSGTCPDHCSHHWCHAHGIHWWHAHDIHGWHAHDIHGWHAHSIHWWRAHDIQWWHAHTLEATTAHAYCGCADLVDSMELSQSSNAMCLLCVSIACACRAWLPCVIHLYMLPAQ